MEVFVFAKRELESTWRLTVSLAQLAFTSDILEHCTCLRIDVVQLGSLEDVIELVCVRVTETLVQVLEIGVSEEDLQERSQRMKVCP